MMPIRPLSGVTGAGWRNKLQAAMGAITPESEMAEQHGKMAEPRRDDETCQKPLG